MNHQKQKPWNNPFIIAIAFIFNYEGMWNKLTNVCLFVIQQYPSFSTVRVSKIDISNVHFCDIFFKGTSPVGETEWLWRQESSMQSPSRLLTNKRKRKLIWAIYPPSKGWELSFLHFSIVFGIQDTNTECWMPKPSVSFPGWTGICPRLRILQFWATVRSYTSHAFMRTRHFVLEHIPSLKTYSPAHMDCHCVSMVNIILYFPWLVFITN